MQNATNLGRLNGIMGLSEETIARIGTVGVAAGGLLALVVFMF